MLDILVYIATIVGALYTVKSYYLAKKPNNRENIHDENKSRLTQKLKSVATPEEQRIRLVQRADVAARVKKEGRARAVRRAKEDQIELLEQARNERQGRAMQHSKAEPARKEFTDRAAAVDALLESLRSDKNKDKNESG